MNVTDSQKASSGAGIVVAAMVANLALTLLSHAVIVLFSSSYEGPFAIIMELLWLGAVGVLAGLFQLSQAVDEPALLYAAMVGLVVADAGLQPAAPTPTAPAADFVIGGILLAVGIGVTTVSMASASNGGRYVVATGAIAVGIVRIIRGFIRLGRASAS